MKLFQEPSLFWPTSQTVTRRQLGQEPARRWCRAMGVPLTLSRKTWERVFIVQSLHSRGMLKPGRSGLGFGVGADPMIPAMVARGAEILATDYGESDVKGWGTGLNLDPRNIAGEDAMRALVRQRNVDMNAIPDDLRGFDFTYSCGSLEHIGGLRQGFDFIESSMDCLRPGGVAVHTTELNISGGTDTLDVANLGFYLPAAVSDLFDRLRSAGHLVAPLNMNMGETSEDKHIAARPYDPPCLKIRHSGYNVTSMGFVITAAGGSRADIKMLTAGVEAARGFAQDSARAVGRRLATLGD